MSNIVLPPLDPNFEKMTSDLERLETLYAEKRVLEAEIENTISEVDREAMRALKSAEEEHQEANLKCASMIARLQRAARDRSPLREEITSTNVFEAMQGADPTIPPPHMDIITALRNQSEDIVPILGPILSPVSTCSDLGSLSVVSDIGVEGSRVPQLTYDVGILNISDSPINASHRLTSLAQHYHSLCHTIDNLRGGINKQAEAMNANALAKLEDAKMQLEASRGKAQAIVEGMRIASNANIYARLPWLLSKDSSTSKSVSVVPSVASINLPWQHGVEKEAHVSERKPPSPTLLPITAVLAIPVPAPQAPVLSPPQKEEIIYDPYWQSTRFAAIHPAPAATSSSNGTLAVQMEDRQYLATPPSISNPSSLSTTMPDLPPYRHRYHPCFEYYERAVTSAKSVNVGFLPIPGIPWPVLTPLTGEFPVPCHHPLLGNKVLLDNMREFICSYAEWKHVPFNEVARMMHHDWLILDSKVKPSNKKGGKMFVARVIERLCVLMGRN